MDESDVNLQSFIVKLWIEDSEENSTNSTWHGTITHVPSGANRSVRSLHEVLNFMKLYLEEKGATEELESEKPFEQMD